MVQTSPTLQAIVDVWNQEHPPGTNVILTKDDGTEFGTKTRSWAEVLSGHTPVVWVNGISGCYLLERVRAVSKEDLSHELRT